MFISFWEYFHKCNRTNRIYVTIYVFSKHWPSGPMLSINQNVRLCVCLCVCSLLRYRLNVFLPPLPKVGCPIFLEIRNPWGKSNGKSGLLFEHFCLKIVKNRRAKKVFFCWFCLTKHGGNHASRWLRPLVEGRIDNFGISLDVFEFLPFGWFFVLKKNQVLGYSWSTRKPHFLMD